jgi:hypothetical protein
MSSKHSRARYQLEPLSLQDAITGPGLSGLNDLLQTMVQSAPSGRSGSVLSFVSPGDTMTPGDFKSPGELESRSDTKSPGGINASGEIMPLRESDHSTQGASVPRRKAGHEMQNYSPSVPKTKHEISKAWTQVQQGLDASEQAVYHYLFAERGADDIVRRKKVSEIAEEIGLSKRTCQRTLQKLRIKHVIEILPYTYGSNFPPQYQVKKYSAILDTWRALGLTHYTTGRTRVLVNPHNPSQRLGERIRPSGQEPSGELQESANSPITVDMTPGDMKSPGDLEELSPGDVKSWKPGDMKSPLSIQGNKNRNKYRNTQATATSDGDIEAVAAVPVCSRRQNGRQADS